MVLLNILRKHKYTIDSIIVGLMCSMLLVMPYFKRVTKICFFLHLF